MPESTLADDLTLECTAPLWRWEARRELWTFVSLPVEVTEDVCDLAGDVPRGLGAVRADGPTPGDEVAVRLQP